MKDKDNKHEDSTAVSLSAKKVKDGGKHLAKMQLAEQINQRVKSRGLKQSQASTLLGLTQPEVSQLANGHLSGFTFDRLYRCLHALNMNVEIVIKENISNSNSGVGITVLH